MILLSQQIKTKGLKSRKKGEHVMKEIIAKLIFSVSKRVAISAHVVASNLEYLSAQRACGFKENCKIRKNKTAGKHQPAVLFLSILTIGYIYIIITINTQIWEKLC